MRDGVFRWWSDGRRAVLAEGVDASALDGLRWEPIGAWPSVFLETAPTVVVSRGEPEEAPEPEDAPGLPRYRVLQKLGEGGLGLVERVWDRVLRREVAMKTPKTGIAAFLGEAQATAMLEHPGIVPVYDAGRLPDGTPYFTMREIGGETLEDRLALGVDRGSLPGIVRVLVRVAEAIAYAHQVGVVHRDLKPANLMLGRFGEVLVLDWGLGAPDPDAEEVTTDAFLRPPTGQVVGTPGYMAPEQAAGLPAGPPADVYALGAILCRAIGGRPPWPEMPPMPAWAPPALLRLMAEALAPSPEARPPGAWVFARRLEAWLDGEEGEAEARARLAEADRHAARAKAAAAEAAATRAGAARHLAAVDPYADAADKAPAWALEQRAEVAEAEAARAIDDERRALYGALQHVPDHADAHGRLAAGYRDDTDRAERVGDEGGARRGEAMVRVHLAHAPAALRDTLGRWLDGAGVVTVHTDRPARVTAARLVSELGRLVPSAPIALGTTPLDAAPLPRGAWLLTLTPEDGPPTLYPVVIGRQGAWDGVAPGEAAPRVLRLPREGELGPDDVLVLDGPFLAGGDPALPSFPRQRVWVDGFVIRRFPVTTAEYLAFLDEVPGAAIPRRADRTPLLTGGPGAWASTQAGWGGPRQPITGVDWASARAFAAWRAGRDGLAWDLPGELWWEKAARGVDGRTYPWGERLDPSFCLARRPGPVGLADVDAWPLDVSVYGVRGLAGNTRDWCLDGFRREGPRVRDGRAVVDDSPGEGDAREARGGHLVEPIAGARVTARGGGLAGQCREYLGFRLARPWGPDPGRPNPR